jgi:hypothetical protein
MKTLLKFLPLGLLLGVVLLSPPSCVASTGSQVIGKSVTLYLVSCDGTQPFTFAWNKNGTAIAGATGTALPSGLAGIANSAYTIAAVAAGDAGVYTCTVTNSAGSTLSDTATLTVTTGPTGAVTGVKVTQNGVTTTYPIG